MTEYIPNSNILIHDRLYENKDIYCGNRLDTLVDNRCYHGDQDPYIATCPIKYDMYKVNNKYTYKFNLRQEKDV
jgi:hypothetical protein